MTTFGINSTNLELAARTIGTALKLDFRPHESDFHGGDYYRAETEYGTVLLQRNLDVLDDEPFEPDWPAERLIFYFDGPDSSDWGSYVKTLCEIENLGARRLAKNFG
jgi:hypothetical protein